MESARAFVYLDAVLSVRVRHVLELFKVRPRDKA